MQQLSLRESLASHPAAHTATGQVTVCQVLHSLNVGGAEVLAARLGEALRDEYRFVFACLDGSGPLAARVRELGFQVAVLDRQPGFDWRCAARLRELMRRERVALLHAHQYTPFFYCLAARAWRRNPPILFTEHGRWFPDYPRRKRIWFNRLAMRKGDRAIGVGHFVKHALVVNEGLPRRRVDVIHNGVNLQEYDRPLADRDAVRREVGAEEGEVTVVQVARLDALKDHLTAIRAFAQAVHTAPGLRLVLVGEGPEETAIRREIAAQDIGNRVSLLGLRHDVPRLLKAADAFLLTSISEGIPLTIIEAMAAGLPVVATDVGGVSEIVGQTGFRAPAKDVDALASGLAQLAADRELRQRMGRAGRERAERTFSEQQNHAAYRKLYGQLLAR